MAKKTLTGFTTDVNNVQALADQPTQSAATLKQIFDTAGNEVKTDGNALVAELQDSTLDTSGAHGIGLGVTGITADNVGDGLKEVYDAIAGVALGAIPDNSITAAKMADDMDKGVAGGVEAYNDALTHKQGHINHIHYAAATGSANVYAVTLDASVTSLSEGFAVAFKPNATNTGTSTLNVNGIGAVTIKTPSGANVSSGQLVSGNIYTLRYNGTNFILQGEGAIGNMVAADLLSGKTGTTAAGLITGTMTNRAGDNASIATSVSGTTLKLRAPGGYYDGTDDTVTLTDADFTEANIKYGVELHGKTGTLLGDKFQPSSLLYADGTQYVTFGEWRAQGSTGPTVDFNADHIYMYASDSSDYEQSITGPSSSIDITAYSTLAVEFEFDNAAYTSGKVNLYTSTTSSHSHKSVDVDAIATITATTELVGHIITIKLDVSALNGAHYLNFNVYDDSGSSSNPQSAKVYRMYLV